MEHTATGASKNRVSRFAVLIADFCNKICHNPTCPLPNRRDDAVTFHDGAAIGMGEIPDHYEDAVVIPSRGYPALWRRQVGEKSNVTPHAPIAP
jgi:hypothetical protein